MWGRGWHWSNGRNGHPPGPHSRQHHRKGGVERSLLHAFTRRGKFGRRPSRLTRRLELQTTCTRHNLRMLGSRGKAKRKPIPGFHSSSIYIPSTTVTED